MAFGVGDDYKLPEPTTEWERRLAQQGPEFYKLSCHFGESIRREAEKERPMTIIDPINSKFGRL